jgi:hypothetical protein
LEQDQQGADPALGERAVALGRRGLSRAEIGPALGMEMAELAALEAADADFARAMRRAGEAERAWWEGQPREALAEPGARFNFGAWREAMRWRFGAAKAAGAGAATAAVEAAAPERPKARYYLPDNLRRVRMADGTPITPLMRREKAVAEVQQFLEIAERKAARAEAQLADAAAELADWREEMRAVERRNYDPDAQDDEDWDEDDDETETEDWDEDDRTDDENGADDAGDADDDDGGANDGAEDGGDGGADGRDGGAGERVSGGAAGCERAVPAGLAGPPAWGAQPHFGADHAGAADELRGQPG